MREAAHIWTDTLHNNQSSLPQEHEQCVLGLKGDILDGVKARESKTLAHSPYRKAITARLGKISGSLSWKGNPWKAVKSRTLEMHQLFWFRYTLSAGQRCPVSGNTEHVSRKYGQSELLDSSTRFWLRMTTMGPGLPALISSNWPTSSLLLENMESHHFVSPAKQGCVSPATQNKVLSPKSWTPQPTPHSRFQILKAIFSSCSLRGSKEKRRSLTNLAERRH